MFETTHFDDMEYAMDFIESLPAQGGRHVSDGLVRSPETKVVHVIVTWERPGPSDGEANGVSAQPE